MAEPRLRYRIDLRTDDRLRWFATLDTYDDDGLPALEQTVTVDTPLEALDLARDRIREKRGS